MKMLGRNTALFATTEKIKWYKISFWSSFKQNYQNHRSSNLYCTKTVTDPHSFNLMELSLQPPPKSPQRNRHPDHQDTITILKVPLTACLPVLPLENPISPISRRPWLQVCPHLWPPLQVAQPVHRPTKLSTVLHLRRLGNLDEPQLHQPRRHWTLPLLLRASGDCQCPLGGFNIIAIVITIIVTIIVSLPAHKVSDSNFLFTCVCVFFHACQTLLGWVCVIWKV